MKNLGLFLSLILLVALSRAAVATSSPEEPMVIKGKKPEFTITQYPGHQKITLEGSILTSWEDRLAVLRLLDEVVPGKNITFALRSRGGFVPNFTKLINGLNSLCTDKSGCVITTLIPWQGLCGSACIDLFLMGDIRVMEPLSGLGFHRMFILSPSVYRSTVKTEIRRLQKRGVSEEWLEINKHIFADSCQEDLCWITPAEALNGNFATEII